MTAIEWATKVWNPTVGCERVSEGCRNCYAERETNIRQHNPKTPQYQGLLTADGRWNGNVQPVYEALYKPIEWRQPQRIFVNSMSDLFHPAVPEGFIRQVFAIMMLPATRHHTFIVLTKRPDRMREILTAGWWTHRPEHQGQNIWLGVSCEDQAAFDERWPLLAKTRAEVRLISAEPLLGPITFRCPVCLGEGFVSRAGGGRSKKFLSTPQNRCPECLGAARNLTIPNWVIAGGESGPNARPVHPDWLRHLRDQCSLAGIPFFFKQWGEWRGFRGTPDVPPRIPGGKAVHHWPADGAERISSVRLGKTKSGRTLDARTWDEFPNFAQADSLERQHCY